MRSSWRSSPGSALGSRHHWCASPARWQQLWGAEAAGAAAARLDALLVEDPARFEDPPEEEEGSAEAEAAAWSAKEEEEEEDEEEASPGRQKPAILRRGPRGVRGCAHRFGPPLIWRDERMGRR